jgi:hypothetical protein
MYTLNIVILGWKGGGELMHLLNISLSLNTLMRLLH